MRGRRSGRLSAAVSLLVVLCLAGAPAGAAAQAGAHAASEGIARPAEEIDAALAARAELLAGAGRAAPGAHDVVPGALLVTTRGMGLLPAVEAAAAAVTGDARTTTVTARTVRVDVPQPALDAVGAALAALPGVLAVEPVRVRQALRVPNDRDYAQQWAHQVAEVEGAWDVTTGDPGVTVAVIDSGVVGSHPDLQGNLLEQLRFAGAQREVRPLGSDNEQCGAGFSHGTAVAGVVGAQGDNGLDLTGVAWRVGILDLAVFQRIGSGCGASDDTVIAAMDYATSRGADVINLSLGGLDAACPQAFQTAVDTARAAGVVVVAAAGNDQQFRPGAHAVPASCNGVISVGAVGRSEAIAGYSQVNDQVDLVAPGGDSDAEGLAGLVLVLDGAGGTRCTEGTSFAAPYVAGAAALLRAAHPGLTPDDVESLLERTARDLGPAGRDGQHGWGLVRVGAAVAAAAEARRTGASIDAPAPDPAFPVGGSGGGSGLPPVEPIVVRVEAGTPTTRPAAQAVAVSEAVFEDRGATHAVVARDDDYADALAGSALGFGFAPLLFTGARGALDPLTGAELRRVLDPGATVYLLGGDAALPTTLEAEIRDLGLRPVRLSGRTREETAVRVGDETDQVLARLGYNPVPVAMLATRQNWPDAVAAGSIAAYFGLPILLTSPDSLHPATAAALARRQPSLLYVIGGGAAISDETMRAARTAAGLPSDGAVRLSGRERTETAIAVAAELEAIFAAVFDAPPTFAVATNVRRADGYAHVLSASVIAGAFGAVFVPVEGDDGSILNASTREYVTGFGIDGVVAGGADLVSRGVEDELLQLLRR
jgi:subtilisin family serine protease/putative cell wall-binding protein